MPGMRIDVVETFKILGRIEGLDGDALDRVTGQGFERFVPAFLLRKRCPVIQGFLGKISHVQAQIDKPLMINDFTGISAYHFRV